MKRYIILSSGLVLGVVMCSALAAPSGFYTFVGGGGSYLEGMQLDSTTISQDNSQWPTVNYGISDSTKAALSYAFSGNVGYYFNNDPLQTRAFGVEAGFNYFGPVTSTAKNSITPYLFPRSFTVDTSEKSTAWAADLEGVYSQDLIIPHTSLIFKLGVGYESMVSTFTNSIPELAKMGVTYLLPSTTKVKTNGFGIAGGLGLQYNFTQHLAARIEFDGFQGEKNLGYGEALAGVVVSF